MSQMDFTKEDNDCVDPMFLGILPLWALTLSVVVRAISGCFKDLGNQSYRKVLNIGELRPRLLPDLT